MTFYSTYTKLDKIIDNQIHKYTCNYIHLRIEFNMFKNQICNKIYFNEIYKY